MLVVAMLLGAAAALLQVPGADGDFVFDDIPAVAENPLVDGRAGLSEVFTRNFWGGRPGYEHVTTWRPLTTLSFRANWALWPHPGAFRVVNALLHGLVACLVALLAARLAGTSAVERRRLALLAGAAFAVMPVHVEAVLCAVNRAELLAAIAWLAGLLGALRGLQRRSSWGWAVFALALPLGLLSKEHVITLPAAVLLIGVVQHLRHLREPVRARAPALPPLWVGPWTVLVLLGWLLARRAVLPATFAGDIPALDNPLVALSGVERVMSTFGVFAHALRLLFAPGRMGVDYGLAVLPSWGSGGEQAALLGLAGYLLLGLGAWLSWRRDPSLFLALALFALCWLPVSSLILPSTAVLGERLLYLPSVAVAVGIAVVGARAWVLAEVRGGRWLLALALAAVAVGGVVRTLTYQQTFRDAETLFAATVVAYPDSVRARQNLAAVLADRGRYDEAETHALVANRVAGGDPDALVLLATVARGRGDLELARSRALESMGLRASRAAAGELCRVECAAEQWSAAAEVCALMAKNEPGAAEWAHRAGVALLTLGRRGEARALLERAAALEPGHPGIRAALGRAVNGDSPGQPR